MIGHVKTIAIALITLMGVCLLAYYLLWNFDCVGKQHTKISHNNSNDMDETLLLAAYSDERLHYEVQLLDTVHIEIRFGDRSGTTKQIKKYQRSGDTLIVSGKNTHAQKYSEQTKFLIQGNHVLIRQNRKGTFDSPIRLSTRMNKLTPASVH